MDYALLSCSLPVMLPSNLAGFEYVETVHESGDSVTYRALRSSEPRRVFVKTVQGRHVSSESRARLRREYRIAASLPRDIAPYLDLLETPEGPAVILEDTGGKPLNQWKPESLESYLEAALRIALALDTVHDAGIVHRDIKPANLVLNPENFHPYIIDYGIASVVPSRSESTLRLEKLEGTLLYMAPEQTGRTNRRVDHRSDLYSLGVTLYELLAGQPPYTYDDPLQLIHAHLASQPAAIKQDRQGNFVPDTINGILQKLMRRDPDERYRSAMGLAHDLKRCLESLRSTGQVQFFEPGKKDFPRGLSLPQKLYGRQKDLQEIQSILDQKERSSLVLVTGPSGSGKSSLIRELRRTVAERNGFFLPGKFEPDKKDIPYHAIARGLSLIADSLLSMPPDNLAKWKEGILQNLKGNGQALVDLVPALGALLGPQPELMDLPPEEQRVRFRLTVLGFLAAFKDVPLVFVLDDLQWADLSSLDLIQDLLIESGPNVTILGTYRDNEVNELHPLRRALESYRSSAISVSTIQLQPLGPRELRMLLMDTFLIDPDSESEAVNQLAEALYRKSEGNPFIARQYLESCYSQGWIHQNRATGEWTFDLARIRTDGLSPSAAELLARRIDGLDELKTTLEAAACLGSRFDLRLLSGLLEQDVLYTLSQLQQLSEHDLIFPLGEHYKYVGEESSAEAIQKVEYAFSHDRIHEAALNQLKASRAEELNLKTARLILSESSFGEIEEKVGTIVSYYNQGRNLVTDDEEKLRISRLNLQAGMRERKASAYDEAIIHFGIALDTLYQRSAGAPRDLRIEILRNLGECEYLNGRKLAAQQYFDKVLKESGSLLDRLRVFEFKIALLSSNGQYSEAVGLGLQALKRAGYSLSGRSTSINKVLRNSLDNKERLLKLYKKRRDQKPSEEDRLLARIFAQTITPAFLTKSERLPFLVHSLLEMSEKKGPFPETSVGLVVLGALACEHLSDYQEGSQAGKLAQELVERFNARDLRGRINYYYLSSIHCWTEPLAGRLPLYQRAMDQCLETGDLPFAGLCIFEMLSQKLIYCNDSLPDLESLFQSYQIPIGRIGQDWALEMFGMLRQSLHNLQGASRQKTSLKGDFFDDTAMEKRWKNAEAHRSLFYLNLYKSFLAVLFGNQTTVKNSKYRGPLSHYDSVFARYVAAIEQIANAKSADARKAWMQQCEETLEVLKGLEKNCPANFAPLKTHLEAELLWKKNELTAAMTAFDQACRSSERYGPAILSGFIRQRTAGLYLAMEKPVFARIYADQARSIYETLKSHAQIEHTDRLLDEIRHQHLALFEQDSEKASKETRLPAVAERNTALNEPSAGLSVQGGETLSDSGSELDLESVMRTAAIVSSEIELDQLLRKLLRSLLESAGARKIVLLEKAGEGYLVRAIQNVEQEPEISPLRSPAEADVPISVINYTDRTRKPAVLDDASNDGSFTHDPYIQSGQISSILCIPIFLKGEIYSLLYLEHATSRGAFSAHRVRVLNLLGAQIATSLENARLYEDVKNALQQEQEARKSEASINRAIRRFVPDEFLQILGVGSFSEIKLGENIEKEMTVLFSDIRGFTSLSESMSPEENFKFINSYLSRVGPLVRESGGFIDKYIGDAVMALFEKPDQGVRAARAMMLQLDRYNQDRKHSGYDPIRIGIGLHTGVLRLGIIGEEGRIEGTVIGDTVNLASRLESLNTTYGTSVIVSQATRDFLQGSTLFHFRALDRVRVKGKNRELWIHELMLNPPAESVLSAYDAAIDSYQTAAFDRSRELFLKLKAERPDDPVIEFYLERLNRIQAQGVPENWEGIENLKKK
ncbi:MAG: hypothetical protein CMN76_01585 [Spirochaetaceae bacterium]|nr:hypothetical protein [Spirochaetaceae bacterium]|tara:strand:- start:884 stop:6316 length:5433 start_codon:yes stop_codon:yes gene_type:complete